jgi:hypothetical protein
LGYEAGTLEAFQQSVRELSGGLGAEDFIELDWFLYQISQHKINLNLKPKAWWVNQGRTYKQQRDGGYLWAPKLSADGKALEHWTNLTRLELEDVVLHYLKGSVRAVSRVVEPAIEATRPAELPEGPWSSEGYLVRADYHELSDHLGIQAIPLEWRTQAAGPFMEQGTVGQVYLSPLSNEFVQKMMDRFAGMFPDFLRALRSTWCIYVSHGAAENFSIARDKQIWGTDQKNKFEGIEKGDSLLFVHDLTSDLVPPPKGFPRVKLPKFRGRAKLLMKGTVTSGPFQDSSKIWPDKPYPHRFRFEETEVRQDDEFNEKAYPSGIVDAVRRSAISQGRPIRTNEEVDLPPNKDSGPLNVILYGPPGTGKTYSVQRRALEIIDPESKGSPPTEAAEAFRKYRAQGRIEFVTFHPSYSYEEFVEGFRYDPEKAVPTLHKGLLQTLVENAVNPLQDLAPAEGARIWKVSLWAGKDLDLFERCMQNDEIAIGWLDGVNLSGTDREGISELFKRHHPGQSIYPVNYLVNELRQGDYVAVFGSLRTIRAIGVVTGGYEYKKEYDHYQHTRPVRWLDDREQDIVGINGNTELTQQTIYELWRIQLQDFVDLLPKPPPYQKPYVLVIDEINRGNISRIFGELITLLEPDKRRGAPNEVSVRLPYSGRSFTVPRNLYVIGTMNSADRSIALVDVALRRRFEFEEMMPDAKVIQEALHERIEQGDAELSPQQVGLICDVFNRLNLLVSVLLDRDHQIGHSYFLSVDSMESLCHALYRKVFPLLQEYFYNDREQLQRLLGRHQEGKRGFVKLLAGNNVVDADGEAISKELLPWELHRYEPAEIEEVLRKTFLTDG